MSGETVVIGLDSSTQGTKAIAWNHRGKPMAEGRAPVPLANPSLDHFEQDPEDWWRSAASALRSCIEQLDGNEIAGLAVSNQRETIAFLDGQGRAVHPAIVWLDERAREQITELCDALGAETIHAVTGRPPDLTPCLYRLAWMRRYAPEAFRQTACFADVQCYLVGRLTDEWFRTGWSSADPLGLFDMQAKRWAPSILSVLGIDADQLPNPAPPASELGRVSAAAAAESGLPRGTPVFAGGGDGQCAGLGTNCTRPERAYINLGTAAVSGVWSPEYRYNRAWRTEIAAQGEGYILENCLRTGAFLVNWFVDNFVPGGHEDTTTFQKLEAAALELPIGSGGVMVQPYWSGAMDPHWDPSARGVVLGLSGSHGTAHVYRAIIEGITLDQVIRTRGLEAAFGQTLDHYVAIGGGASSPLWRQMLADASGKDVLISETVEASALGAGMIAAAGAGWYPSIVEAATAMAGATWRVAPREKAMLSYQQLLDIYTDVYAATAESNQRLVAFANQGESA